MNQKGPLVIPATNMGTLLKKESDNMFIDRMDKQNKVRVHKRRMSGASDTRQTENDDSQNLKSTHLYYQSKSPSDTARQLDRKSSRKRNLKNNSEMSVSSSRRSIGGGPKSG